MNVGFEMGLFRCMENLFQARFSLRWVLFHILMNRCPNEPCFIQVVDVFSNS